MATRKKKTAGKTEHQFTRPEIKCLAEEIQAEVVGLLKFHRLDPVPCKHLETGLKCVQMKAEMLVVHTRD